MGVHALHVPAPTGLPSPGEDVDQGEPTRARNSWYSAQKHLLGPYTAEIARTQVTIAVVNQERPQDVDRVRRRAVRALLSPIAVKSRSTRSGAGTPYSSCRRPGAVERREPLMCRMRVALS